MFTFKVRLLFLDILKTKNGVRGRWAKGAGGEFKGVDVKGSVVKGMMNERSEFNSEKVVGIVEAKDW